MRITQFVIVAAIAAVPSFAQAEPGPRRGACMQDVKTLCAGVQPGGGRIRECIREHRAQLSQDCKMAIAERMMERRQNRPGSNRGQDTPKHDAD
jgi:hypothetical protein